MHVILNFMKCKLLRVCYFIFSLTICTHYSFHRINWAHIERRRAKEERVPVLPMHTIVFVFCHKQLKYWTLQCYVNLSLSFSIFHSIHPTIQKGRDGKGSPLKKNDWNKLLYASICMLHLVLIVMLKCWVNWRHRVIKRMTKHHLVSLSLFLFLSYPWIMLKRAEERKKSWDWIAKILLPWHDCVKDRSIPPSLSLSPLHNCSPGSYPVLLFQTIIWIYSNWPGWSE